MLGCLKPRQNKYNFWKWTYHFLVTKQAVYYFSHYLKYQTTNHYFSMKCIQPLGVYLFGNAIAIELKFFEDSDTQEAKL